MRYRPVQLSLLLLLRLMSFLFLHTFVDQEKYTKKYEHCNHTKNYLYGFPRLVVTDSFLRAGTAANENRVTSQDTFADSFLIAAIQICGAFGSVLALSDANIVQAAV